MGKETNLLDLCCGGGQLAMGFSKYVGHVTAVDASREMLKYAPRVANVDYICADVNSPQLLETLGEKKFDHFSIGRSIMYFEDNSLVALANKYLKAGGSLLVMASGWSQKAEWFQVFDRLRRNYGLGGTVDCHGAARLTNLGFKIQDRVSVQAKVSCDIPYLVQHAMSYPASYDGVKSRLEDFKADLSRELTTHLRNGKLLGILSSWAVIHRRSS